MIAMNRRYVVTFGRKMSDAVVLRQLAAYRQRKDTVGVAIFERGATPPLRLGVDDGLRFPPSFLADVPDTASKLARLKADVAREFDLFAKNPQLLLDLYFDFIAARLDEDATELAQRMRPLGGLFRVEDWAFSALRPMPNAAVFDADEPESEPGVVLHDMAFWTGETVLTIRLRGSATQSSREADTCARLEAMGVRIVTIPVPELTAGTGIFSSPRFPAEFLSFWQDAPYPCSPFRPQGLTRSLSLD
jgi:hypothetical protein